MSNPSQREVDSLHLANDFFLRENNKNHCVCRFFKYAWKTTPWLIKKDQASACISNTCKKRTSKLCSFYCVGMHSQNTELALQRAKTAQ